MNPRSILVSFCWLLCYCQSLFGAEFEPPLYEIYRTTSPIQIDGKLDEPAWFAAPAASPFHFTWYKDGEQEQTFVKMLWDDENLYIGHICQDAHITARYKNHDDPIPKDDCFEVMIAPDSSRGDFYYNIEWNLLGGYVDGHRPAGAQGPRVPWDAKGLQIAGSYAGTLNEDGDRDQHWIGEVAIPLSNFADAMPPDQPTPGYSWRLNINRHGGDTNMQYSQWSPGDTPAPAFHTPHRFGKVIFSDRSSPFTPITPTLGAATNSE